MTDLFRVMGILVLVAVVLGCGVAAVKSTEESVTATVTKTERIVEGDGKEVTSRYLVFTDRETFQDSDSLLYLKFNSSDVYGRIEPGRKYRFVVYGFRIPVFSSYRNIVSSAAVD